MDYRRRWQQTRLRRTRQRPALALGVLALGALIGLVVHYAERSGAVWIYTPPRPGVVHLAVEGSTLCAVWDTGRLIALDVNSGAERPDSEFRRAFPFLGPPLLAKGRVLFGSEEGRLRCVDLASGTALWEHRTGGAVRSQPVIVGERVLFGSDDGFLYCVELGTGVRRWRTSCGGALSTAPVVTGNRAVVGTIGYGIGGVDLSEAAPSAPADSGESTPDGATASPAAPERNAPERWRWGVGVRAPVLSPPVEYAEGKVAVGSDEGALYMLNAADGQVLLRLHRAGLVRGSPAPVPGGLVVADTSGTVSCVTPDGQVRWSRHLRSNPLAGPVAAGAAVYVATAGGEVLALGSDTGRVLWHRNLPAPASGALAVTEDLVVVGLVEGRICAFRRPPRG